MNIIEASFKILSSMFIHPSFDGDSLITIKFTVSRNEAQRFFRWASFCEFWNTQVNADSFIVVNPHLPAELYDVWRAAMEAAEAHYMTLAAKDKQAAKLLLPVSARVETITTARVTEWQKFFDRAKDDKKFKGSIFEQALKEILDILPNFQTLISARPDSQF